MTDSGYAVLDSMIAQLEGLGEAMTEGAAPEVGRVLEREVKRTIGAGTDAYGVPWKPTLDGELPLQGAKDELRVGVVGDTAILHLRSIHVRHHRGFVRGGKRRGILPVAKIPPAMADGISKVLAAHFERVMGGVR